jgi:hypothetical protein
MFARARLVTGSKEFESFYTMYPEHLQEDNLTRSKPGLLSPDSRFANPLLFASPHGSFYLTGALREAVDGPVSEERQQVSIEKVTDYIKSLTIYFGGLDVGITNLKPYHVYSHIGRGTGEYGASIPIDHKNAIAFTVEMDHQMISSNPTPPGTMETAKQYVESARIAVLRPSFENWDIQQEPILMVITGLSRLSSHEMQD